MSKVVGSSGIVPFPFCTYFTFTIVDVPQSQVVGIEKVLPLFIRPKLLGTDEVTSHSLFFIFTCSCYPTSAQYKGELKESNTLNRTVLIVITVFTGPNPLFDI